MPRGRPGPRATSALLLAGLALWPGCACDTVPSGAVQDCQATQLVPDAVQTDILFVVDDSASMADNQVTLSAALGTFIDALVASPVANDFQIGVTNTSVEGYPATPSARTTYASGPVAGIPYPAGAIVAIAKTAAGNGIVGSLIFNATTYASTGGWGGNRLLDQGSPTLARDFKANVRQGTAGSVKEQPFRVARLALSDRLADTNQGFLRPGARLAVFMISDEDDCSDSAAPWAASDADCHSQAVKNADPPILDTVDGFAQFLLGPLDGELRDVVVGAIAGLDPANPSLPSCGQPQCANQACASAYEQGDRFVALAGILGGARVRLGSICDASFQATLLRFAEIVMPSTVPLQGTPADWRMLAVSLSKVGGPTVACTVAADNTPAAATADAVYLAPAFGQPAQLRFQNACRLGFGDQISVRVVCAG